MRNTTVESLVPRPPYRKPQVCSSVYGSVGQNLVLSYSSASLQGNLLQSGSTSNGQTLWAAIRSHALLAAFQLPPSMLHNV